MLAKSRQFFDLLIGMTEKELRARYKNTLFGFLWIIVNPILQMLVIGTIFRLFLKQPIENYFLYLFSGLLVWNFFSLSLTKATPSIVNERSLIKKAKFSRSIVPLSIILSNFIHLVLAFGLLFIVVTFLGTLSSYWIIRLFLGFTLVFVFTAGLSLLTSALNVRFRDVNFMVQAGLILWFYLTPVVYSLSIIPVNLIWLWALNPLTSVVQLFQSALTEAPPPEPTMLLTNSILILFVVAIGARLFQRESKNFDDWV